MSRAKTQNPHKAQLQRKRVATPPQLTPIAEEDVDAAFAALTGEPAPAKPERTPSHAEADAVAAVEALAGLDDAGEDFAPKLAEEAAAHPVKKRAPTISDDPPEQPRRAAPPPRPPGKRPLPPPKPSSDIDPPTEISRSKPASDAIDPPTDVPRRASDTLDPPTDVPRRASDTLDPPTDVPRTAIDPPTDVPRTAIDPPTDVPRRASDTLDPPTEVPKKLAAKKPVVPTPSTPVNRLPPRTMPPKPPPRARPTSSVPLTRPAPPRPATASTPPPRPATTPPPLAELAELPASRETPQPPELARRFPRSESVVMSAPAYVPRAPTANDFDSEVPDADATRVDPDKLNALIEAAKAAPASPAKPAPAKAALPPPFPSEEPAPADPPSRTLPARFDSDPGFLQPVPTKILDAALTMDELSEIGRAPRAPSRGPRAESEFDYGNLALTPAPPSTRAVSDGDFSGLRARPGTLDRALRDSAANIPVDDLDDAYGRPRAGAPHHEAELPTLQLAVYETSVNLQTARMAIAAAGHRLIVGANDAGGLEKIGMAMADGELDAIIVGIPGGEVLIKAAQSLAPHGPVVIAATSAAPGEAPRDAHAAYADLVAIRPHDADRLAPVLLAATRILEHRRDLGALLAARQSDADLLARLERGRAQSEVGGLQSFETFQRSLETELKRVTRYHYPLTMALFAFESDAKTPPGIAGILRARAGNALLQSIRDIDLATELDHDRFLVCLPYTELRNATEVARRILAAVAEIPAIASGGHEYRARLVGAVAGTKPGTTLQKLLRDATQALDNARRDGAELAVQP